VRAVSVASVSVLIVVLGMACTREPGSTDETASLRRSPAAAQDDVLQVPAQEPAGDVAARIGCVQNALGGSEAFARVSSLRIKSDSKPSASTGIRPLPGTRELTVIFPDRYARVDKGISRSTRNPGTLSTVIGFDGDVLLSQPGVPDRREAMQLAREDFARQMLMRFPRVLSGGTLWHRGKREAGMDRAMIDARGPDGTWATLSVNPETCIPMSLTFKTGQITWDVSLSAYRSFGGIKFPTVLLTSKGGIPHSEESVSAIELNPRDVAKSFVRDR